jgi:hypothetical protein
MKIRTKAPNFALTKELNENTNKSTKFWLKVWQDWALAREYDLDGEVSNFVPEPTAQGTNSPRLFTPGETKALAKSKVHQ